jgi:hypothetical protein
MAYKFQAGDATLSGSVTLVAYQDLLFESDGVSDIGTAASEVGVTYTTRLTASVGLSGSAIFADNFYGNGSNLTGVSAADTTVTGSSANTDLQLVLVQNVGSDVSLAADNAGAIAFNPSTNLLSSIGDIAAVDLSGSDVVAGKSVLLGQNGNIGATGHTDLITLSTNSVVVEGAISGALSISGKSVLLGQNGNIGAVGDADLLALATNSLTVNGAVGATGAISGSSTLTIVGAANFGAAAYASIAADGDLAAVAGTFTGAISGSSTLSAAGNVQLDGADDSAAFVAADDVYFRDAGSGQMRRDSWSDIMAVTAGDGITNTSGVLSVAGTQNIDVDTIGNASRQLTSMGINYATASITANRTFTLPTSPSSGDVIYVKFAGFSGGKHAVISGSGMQLIDGATAITASSAYASVSLVYVASDVWRIF